MKILIIVFGLFSFLAQAAEVKVNGNRYSDTNCRYASTSSSDLKFTFKESLPYGSRVQVRFGFHNEFGGSSHWVGLQEKEMTATAPYTWTVSVNEIQTSSRGSYNFTDVEFAFQIILPNGQIKWDNGGSIAGHYSAELGAQTCERGKVVGLPIRIVKR